MKLFTAYDILINGVVFSDMKLAGIIFICTGFIMVLTPPNWDTILKQVLRWRKPSISAISGFVPKSDMRTGYIESRLRSPSGRVR